MYAAEPRVECLAMHSRDTLEEFIEHYNKEFSTNFTAKESQSFYNYYNDIADEFYKFWNEERKMALESLTKEENLDFEKIQKLTRNYLFTEKQPLRDNLIGAMNYRRALKERKSIAERISSKIRKVY